MRKNLLFITIIILLTAGCVSKEELEKANTNISTLESQLKVALQEKSELELVLDDLNSSFEELQIDNADLQSNYSETISELASTNRLVERLVCPDQIQGMKYTDVFDASTIVAAWWARQTEVESVHGTYRDHIWSNADTKIHGVRYTSSSDHQQYVEHFLIYFREFGMEPGVFWVGGQCWLDSP